jgi:hypothetical protein
MCQEHRKGYSFLADQSLERSTPMPQRAATISSLPMAFELAKALRADGLNWSEGYRPLGRRALAEIIEGRMAEAGFARGSGVSGVQGFQGLRGHDTNCRISRPAVDARLSRSGRPAPRRRSLPKLHGAGSAAVGFRDGACAAALAPTPLQKIAATISFR